MFACSTPCLTCENSETFCLTCQDILRTVDLITGQCLCNSGYLEIQNTCQQCLSPCKECKTEITQCENCLDQNMNLINNQCICNSGYLSQANLCLKCVSTCLECQGDQYSCTTCAKDLTLIDGICVCLNFLVYPQWPNYCYCNTSQTWINYSDSICKATCIDGCNQCNGLLRCSQCSAGYYLNQINCDRCVDYCSVCSNPLTCTQCNDYYFINTQQTCTQCCSYCKNCISENCSDCTKCHENYYLNNGSCLQCQLPCYSCTSDSYCLNCNQQLSEAINGSCYCISTSIKLNDVCTDCTDPCKTCESTTTYCKSCKDVLMSLNDGICTCPPDTHILNTNYCQPCILPCKYCVYSYDYCTVCLDIAELQSNHSCKCPDGFAFVVTELKCLPCQLPCINCINFTNSCTSCIDQLMYVSSSRCICQDGYVDILNVCEPCISPCKTCINSKEFCKGCIDINMNLIQSTGICQCKSNYLNENDICYICTLPCATCSVEVQLCDSCIDPNMDIQQGICSCRQTFGQISNKCYPCISPCVNCLENQNYCTSCIDSHMNIQSGLCVCDPGYYSKTVSFCDVCKYPCSTCSVSDTYCNSCIIDLNRTLTGNQCPCDFGYYDDGICKLCLFPCQSCISEQICSSCTPIHMNPIQGICQCDQGYFLSNYECLKCDEQCLTCEVTLQNCLDCIDINMDLNSDPKCQCKFGYYQSSPQQCTQCIRPCETCLGTATFCISCIKENLVLIDNACICLEGYAEINSKCLLCKLPCATCSGPLTLCTTCIDPIQSLDSGTCNCPSDHFFDQNFMCQKCQSPCLTCQGSSTFCLKCNDGLMELNNQNQCKCQIGYYENNEKCYKCINGCEYCEDNVTCNLCSQNYLLNQQNICEQCQEPCLTCEISTKTCTSCMNAQLKAVNNICQCQNSEYISDNYCYPCSNYCQTCSSIKSCTKCFAINNLVLIDGYCICSEGYIDNGSGCQICNSYCKTCENAVNQCTKCFETQNRDLKNKQCVCSKGYFDDGDLGCFQCTNINGIDRQECNYINCGDGIFTWGEKCDDGNDIPRDGCTNCQIDDGYQCINQILTTSSCQTCTQNCIDCDQQLWCNQCAEGYYLLDQKCLVCQDICQSCDKLSECRECKYLEVNGKCQTCEQKQGYSLDSKSQQCITVCGDGVQSNIEQCDDGNLLNGDGCDQYCKQETGFKNIRGVMIYVQPLKPQVQELFQNQNLYKPNRTFILTYNYQLQNQTIDFLKYINISITNMKLQIDYDIELDNLNVFGTEGINFTLKLNLQLKNSMRNEKLCIQFIKPSKFVSYNKVTQNVKEVNLIISQYQFIDQSTKDNSQIMKKLNENIIYIMGGLVLVGILSGGVNIFYSILDLLQLISYLRYINADYPYNLQEFFSLFQFAQTSYLNQYIRTNGINDYIYGSINKSQIMQPSQKIANDGFSTNIILNIQPILSVWITFLSLYLVSNIAYDIALGFKISRVNEKSLFKLKLANLQYFIKKLIIKSSWKFKKSFFWSIFLRTFYSTAYDLSFIFVLNLQNFQSNTRFYVNQIGQLLSLSILLLYLFIIFKQLSIFSQKRYFSTQILNQFGAIYEGLHIDRFSMHFNTFNLLKKMLFMMALILLDEFPLFQTTSILILNILTVLYLLIFQPLSEKNEYLKQSTSEIQITLWKF